MSDPDNAQPKRRRVCVLLLQLGGPASTAEIEPFLRNLFEDVLWVPIWLRRSAARFMARRRAPKVAPLYEEIGGGSPILPNTEAQAAALEAELRRAGLDARVLICMRYSPPRAADALEEARRKWSDATWVALPLYPQYSYATTRSSLEELDGLLTTAEQARLQIVSAYPADPGYLDAVAETIREGLLRFPEGERDEVDLLFSAHGLPLRLVEQGDPYPEHVRQSVDGVLERLGTDLRYHLSFQSRVGPVRWLEPSTEAKVAELGNAGVRRLLVVPIAFVSEHVETLHELDIQLAEKARAAGIERFERAPTPGDRPAFVAALARQVNRALPHDSTPPS
jgi:ferrochelatase